MTSLGYRAWQFYRKTGTLPITAGFNKSDRQKFKGLIDKTLRDLEKKYPFVSITDFEEFINSEEFNNYIELQPNDGRWDLIYCGQVLSHYINLNIPAEEFFQEFLDNLELNICKDQQLKSLLDLKYDKIAEKDHESQILILDGISQKIDHLSDKLWDFARCYSNDQVLKTESCLQKWSITNDQLLKVADNALEIANDSYERGLALLMIGNFGKAELEFSNSIKLHPEKAEYYFRRGNARYLQKNYEGCCRDYSEVIRFESNNALAWTFKSGALGNLSKHKKAFEASIRAIELNPKLAAAWANNAAALDSLGNYENALKAIDTAIKLDPKLAKAYSTKASILGNLGRYEEALETSNNALDLDYRNSVAWSNKASALKSLGKYLEALKASNNAIALDPTLVNPFIIKAIALYNLSKYEEALEAHNIVLELDPNNEITWSNKAFILIKLGEFEGAIEASTKSIELNYKDTAAWINKSVALGNLGKNEDALKAVNKAIELDPKSINAWSVKYLVLKKLGRYVEALEASSKVTKIQKINNEYI